MAGRRLLWIERLIWLSSRNLTSRCLRYSEDPDRTAGDPGHRSTSDTGLGNVVHVSAHTGIGLDQLRIELDRIAFDPVTIPTLVLNHRHRTAIAAARAALAAG